MTTLTHSGHRAQKDHAGAARLTSGFAALVAFFKQWAAVGREMTEAGNDPRLSVRAKRLLRAGY